MQPDAPVKNSRICFPASLQSLQKYDTSAAASFLSLSFNSAPFWAEVANRHLAEAQDASEHIVAASRANDDSALGTALGREVMAGMQAVATSCIAVDAYYASVKEYLALPPSVLAAWRKNGTPRYARVIETLRRAFHVSRDEVKVLRTALKENFDLRDAAVHPPGQAGSPLMYPNIGRATEWRYVLFGFTNAKVVVGRNLIVIAESVRLKPRIETAHFRDYCRATAELLTPVLRSWEEEHGSLVSP